jgi:hypothetical protein
MCVFVSQTTILNAVLRLVVSLYLLTNLSNLFRVNEIGAFLSRSAHSDELGVPLGDAGANERIRTPCSLCVAHSLLPPTPFPSLLSRFLSFVSNISYQTVSRSSALSKPWLTQQVQHPTLQLPCPPQVSTNRLAPTTGLSFRRLSTTPISSG